MRKIENGVEPTREEINAVVKALIQTEFWKQSRKRKTAIINGVKYGRVK